MKKISIVGLGYIGLPLAVSFSKYFKVVGFDKDKARINQLNNFYDSTNEYSKHILKKIKNKNLVFSSNAFDLNDSNYFIIAVPTPVNKKNNPDLSLLIKATKIVSKFISSNSFVIYESTVYPGVTENICIPIIEKISKKKINQDFFVGYSPERINPGDKIKNIQNVIKLTSGSNQYAADEVDKLYKKIVKVGTFKVNKIKEAEAAKVIENVQRDVNIALINEFSKLFSKLKINTNKVLEAASTKWNFLDFKPGLVGGHCIGVDPYYLTYIALKNKYNPKIILSGRSINNSMANFVSKKIITTLKENKKILNKSKLLILGCTFKENCPDVRNSKVFDIYRKLKSQLSVIDLHDPYADRVIVKKKYKINLTDKLKTNHYDMVVIAVKHDFYKNLKIYKISKLCNKQKILIDLLNLFPNYNLFWKL